MVPTFIIGCIMSILFAIGYIPGLNELSDATKLNLMNFLKIFGSGNTLQGIGVLAMVSGSVAMLFDTYNLLASSKPAR
jgi:hypothetical protein